MVKPSFLHRFLALEFPGLLPILRPKNREPYFQMKKDSLEVRHGTTT